MGLLGRAPDGGCGFRGTKSTRRSAGTDYPRQPKPKVNCIECGSCRGLSAGAVQALCEAAVIFMMRQLDGLYGEDDDLSIHVASDFVEK